MDPCRFRTGARDLDPVPPQLAEYRHRGSMRHGCRGVPCSAGALPNGRARRASRRSSLPSFDPAAIPAQEPIDPALDAAVHRYFETQESEDVAGDPSLWGSAAQRPSPAMLQFVFSAGDDCYSDIAVLRVVATPEGARVRVTAMRERTTTPAQGAGSTTRGPVTMSLIFVKEDGAWKLLREAPAVDDLAASLLEAPGSEARERLLAAEPALVTVALAGALSRRGTDLGAHPAVRRRANGLRAGPGDRAPGGRSQAGGETLQNLANALYFQRNFPRALESVRTAAGHRARAARPGSHRGRPRRDCDDQIHLCRVPASRWRLTATPWRSRRRYRIVRPLRRRRSAPATSFICLASFRPRSPTIAAAATSIAGCRTRRGEASALGGLGRVYVAQGDYAGRARRLRRGACPGAGAQPSAVAGHGAHVTWVRSTSGSATSPRRARRSRRAGAISSSSAMPRTPGASGRISRSSTCWAARSRPPNADMAAAPTFRATAADRDCVAGAIMGLGYTQTAQDWFADAAVSYTRAVEAFTALKRVEPAARAEVGLAQALTGLGRTDDALAAAGRARQTAIGASLDDVLWRALLAEARAHRKAGAIDRALGLARAAIYAVNDMREAARIQPGSPLPRDTATAFATLATLQAANGDAAAAFDTSERMRVHDLRAALTPSEREIARGMTAAERDEERTAAVAVVSLRAQMVREHALPRPDAARLADFERRLAEAVATRAAQQDRLFARLPDLRRWRGLFDAGGDRGHLAHFSMAMRCSSTSWWTRTGCSRSPRGRTRAS